MKNKVLLNYMNEQKLNQKQMAELLGVSISAMSRYINNSRRPQMNILFRMHDIGININEYAKEVVEHENRKDS